MSIEREANIIPIEDQNEVINNLSLVKKMLDGHANFSLPFIKMKKWLVVPVESAYHFDNEDIKLLCNAIRTFGYQEIIAVATEPLTDTPLSYRVTLSQAGLTEFNRACCLFNYVLTTQNLGSVDICL